MFLDHLYLLREGGLKTFAVVERAHWVDDGVCEQDMCPHFLPTPTLHWIHLRGTSPILFVPLALCLCINDLSVDISAQQKKEVYLGLLWSSSSSHPSFVSTLDSFPRLQPASIETVVFPVQQFVLNKLFNIENSSSLSFPIFPIFLQLRLLLRE